MKKVFRLFIASLLTASLVLATVICCCIAPSVMAHFHKEAVCSHCPNQSSHGNSSSPTGTCQNQLISAEFIHSQTISSPIVSANPFPVSVFLNNHQITLTHSILLAYPPGGPPLGISFTPLYLRTFNLRI
jgi:hypothetical protein